MMRVPGSELNPEYEGFLMDLLQELAKDVGFQFTIEENEKYGSLDAETGNWTGMIGKLVNEVKLILLLFFFLSVALIGPRSVAINRLHPCSYLSQPHTLKSNS